MGGFKIESENNEMSFQDWVVWEISDWLDSLSFFDDSEDWFNLEDYKNSFITIDKIYKNLNDWKCLFAHTDEEDDDGDAVLLVINYKTKEFVRIYRNLDYLNEVVKMDRIELDQAEKEIERLKKQGFVEL